MSEFLAWKKSEDRYFGTGDATAEYFHKPWPADAPHNLVETSYFGFSIPEEKINCEIYHWVHPVYGLASGGIFITRGIKTNQMDAAYSNWMNYMPIPDDMTDCTYGNGITVKMRRPLEEWEVSFEDPATKTSLRLNLEAIMPVAFRPVGGHFTQALKTSGELVLHGTSYKIDGFFTRDRSWGDPRSEAKLDPPPAGWHVAVFSDELAFHDFSFESPELNPRIAARYPGFENGRNLLWGYVWKNGELRGVKRTTTHTEFGLRGVGPTKVSLDILDERDELHELRGTIEAAVPFAFWPNLPCFFCLTRWNYRGLTGWGDTQIGVYEAFARENLRD
jgi:hypothetical protein